jgi:hypothetical protein
MMNQYLSVRIRFRETGDGHSLHPCAAASIRSASTVGEGITCTSISVKGDSKQEASPFFEQNGRSPVRFELLRSFGIHAAA